MIEVVERLLGKGYDLRIYDKNVNVASLVELIGTFLTVFRILQFMVKDVEAVMDHAETIVIGTKDHPDFKDVPKRLRASQRLV